jgi:hydrogenase maturation protease
MRVQRTALPPAILSTMPRVLIIAYGNPLRSDDGVAWHAAKQLSEKFSQEQGEIQVQHQLGPELAESISRSSLTIFIDASSGTGRIGEVRVQRLEAHSTDAPRFCHSLSPSAVLAMAKQLYGTTPNAFSVTATGENFEHGEHLSPSLQAAVPELIRRVEELVRSQVKS